MKSIRLLSLPVAGFLLMTMGLPAFAQPGCGHATLEAASLIDMFMAEDKTTLVNALVTLETALEEAKDALDRADLIFYESRIEAAGALLTAIEARVQLNQVRLIQERATIELAGTQKELKDLRAQPTSQENNSDIAFVEAELRSLQRIAEGTEHDLLDAKRHLETAEFDAAVTEAVVGNAERAYASGKRQVGSVDREIDTAHQSFDDERESVKSLVAVLSDEQRRALNRSLKPVVTDEFMLVNIDAVHLRKVLDDGYNGQQIEFLAKALRTEAEYRQIALVTGDRRILDMAVSEKKRILAEIDRLEAEKFDAAQGDKGAFGIASHPGGDDISGHDFGK